MSYSEEEHLEALAKHGWHGVPWDERTPKGRAELRNTDWCMIAEAWLIGGTIAASLAFGLWDLASYLFK